MPTRHWVLPEALAADEHGEGMAGASLAAFVDRNSKPCGGGVRAGHITGTQGPKGFSHWVQQAGLRSGTARQIPLRSLYAANAQVAMASSALAP